jgi:uncharacterized membrane protein
VPNISVLVAILMTLLSVGVLIYFVHHIPETLNVGNITARIGRSLRDRLRKLVGPENEGRPRIDAHIDQYDLDKAVRVTAEDEGYVQTLNLPYLLKLATEKNLMIDLQFQPGDFVIHGDILLDFWKEDGSEVQNDVKDDIIVKARSAYAMGQSRTVHQNYLYLADELVEVLARALSPGTNDPYTAVNCIHWFQSALNVMVNKPDPVADRFDDDNRRRIIMKPLTFEKLLQLIAGKSRAYVAADKIAAMEMLSMLGKLRAKTRIETRKKALEIEMSSLVRAAYDALPSEVDREALAELATRISSGIIDAQAIEKSRHEESWLGGSA